MVLFIFEKYYLCLLIVLARIANPRDRDGTLATDTTDDYAYDLLGNMVSDENKGIRTIQYNHLNLPTYIDLGGKGNISYIYDATGRKVRKFVQDDVLTQNKQVDYADGFQYENNIIQFFPTAEGYASRLTTKIEQTGRMIKIPIEELPEDQFSYVYNYTDHLGNIRLSYSLDPDTQQLKIVEQNHYYPFGMRHSNYSGGRMVMVKDEELKRMAPATEEFLTYKYKYNGKEYQDELGLNFYDYGARNYDAALGRWMNIDPLAEKGHEYSPYSFCFNIPTRFIDPNGLWPIYSTNGTYLGDDGRSEEGKDLAFTGEKNKDGSYTNLNQFTDNHTDFTKAAGKVRKESSGDKTESLWIAHTANNASKNKDTKKGEGAMGQLLSKEYSTTNAPAVSVNDNSSKTNNARAGLINVLSGGADPTGGAVLWDGKDFLPKGLDHNKFKEYGNVTISGSDLNNFISNQRSLYGTQASDDYSQSNTLIPGYSGWLGNNFYSNEPSNNKTYYNLTSAGVQGGTIFWKIIKK